MVPPPSRPHFLSPALRTKHFSTFLGLTQVVCEHCRQFSTCNLFLPATLSAVLEKGWKRLLGQALAYPGDVSGKPQQDAAQEYTAAFLSPPCGCHHPTIPGEPSGANTLLPPPTVRICYRTPCEPKLGSQYKHWMRSSSSGLFSIPRSLW